MTDFDLVIIGGGINGTGIARDAAGRGLKVCLLEQGDLGGATSSNSSKLIHGGLRYLEHYEFRLVRESLKEREVLYKIAPHLIKPIRIVLPHHKDLRPAWMLRLGLFMYDHMGGRKLIPPTKKIDLTTSKFDHLKKDVFKFGFEFSDCWVDDARLVILNALSAQENGADIRVRTKCTHLTSVDGQWQVTLKPQNSDPETITTKMVVNACGMHTEKLLDKAIPTEDETQKNRLRLVRGSHIVTKKIHEGDHFYMFQNKDDRIIFVIPYENDFTLIGTTDAPQHIDEPVKISDAERQYLIDSVNEYLENPLTTQDIFWDYAGVRPLFNNDKENASTITRDYVLEISEYQGAKILSIFGGKITTYRELAEHAMQKMADILPTKTGAWTDKTFLPGGDLPSQNGAAGVPAIDDFKANLQSTYGFVPQAVLDRWFRSYGTRIDLMTGRAQLIADLGIYFGAGLYQTEVDYLIQYEWARTAQDILWRRTKLGLHMDDAQKEKLDMYMNTHPALV